MKKTICSLAVVAALVSPSVFAHKQGDFVLRVGAASVVPNDSSDKILGSQEELKVDSNTQLGLTFGYMFTDNISLELLAATPFSHDISTDLVGSDIADTKHLPPTLMVQYYFGEPQSKFRPYVGAGLNYTIFFDEGFNNTGKAAGLSDLKLDDSFGLAANVGVDYMINDQWFLNASAWYANIETEATYKAGGAKQKTDVKINPWVFMISGGYKF
ncbi:outer membrane protein OmpW [Vibrio parahaemolyticus]|uniref:outer membrane protein OmpW n=1 Tax=Vibrio parahaemolyticus TaxID=670 RepID=UPI0003ED8E5A|nr:outer membrane protein OmpW [Vibrio parahaemolyticus]AHJ01211.1 Outer membrane protein W precursor [Vibrio parahaemolyticus UCM-V493]EGR2187228.1 outer membrane protein OmpW [Vibrio parahaemolyticus]EHH1058070.1 outer membrane protein OmpW [Vibrio parahaemolyticus]EHH1061002.1 outer membrane protein OmpW [Vibrio parahaemolyticus]MBE3979270.1 outer membrane protein OmpW [Vibrio parahaemolyticus]